MSKKLTIEIIIALLVLLFAYTGLSKLAEFMNFEHQLSKSPWTLLAHFSSFVAKALPIGELLIVILLVIPKTRLLGLSVSFVIMIAFTAYIGIMLISGVDLPCSCGGVIRYMPWNWHLVFNLFFTLLALAGIILQRKVNKGRDNNSPLLQQIHT